MTVQQVDTSAVATQVAERAEGEIKPGRTLQDLIREQMSEVGKGLPPGTLTSERFVRTVLTEVRRNEGLTNCTVPSFMGAMMQSAQLGLEVGSTLGQAYLIPYYDRNKKVTECQFQIGYKGWIILGARSGILIESREVRQHDKFKFRFGTSPYLDHSWDATTDRGELVCFYGTATMPDGRMRFHVMSIPEIHERRDRSAAVKAGVNTPWKTDYDAMCRKTVIRAMVPQLPMSPELNSALAVDEATLTQDRKGEIRPNFPEAIDVQPLQPGDMEISTTPLSEEKEILTEVIGQIEDPNQRLACSAFIASRYGSVFDMDDNLVQEATDIALGWPDTRDAAVSGQGPHVEDGQHGGHQIDYLPPPESPESGATSVPVGDTRVTVTEGTPVANEPDSDQVEFVPGVDISFELANDTMNRINAWPLDTVNRILREQNVKIHGNAGEKNRRMTLYQHLVVGRAKGVQSITDLF